jgi:hypothetical protein
VEPDNDPGDSGGFGLSPDILPAFEVARRLGGAVLDFARANLRFLDSLTFVERVSTD